MTPYVLNKVVADSMVTEKHTHESTTVAIYTPDVHVYASRDKSTFQRYLYDSICDMFNTVNLDC